MFGRGFADALRACRDKGRAVVLVSTATHVSEVARGRNILNHVRTSLSGWASDLAGCFAEVCVTDEVETDIKVNLKDFPLCKKLLCIPNLLGKGGRFQDRKGESSTVQVAPK